MKAIKKRRNTPAFPAGRQYPIRPSTSSGHVPSGVEGRNTKDRPTWDEYFLSIAELVSSRSTCVRRKVGAVIVKDKRILSTGYNGAPSMIEHCSLAGCLREKLKIPSGERHELCRGLHGEQNAFLQAALHGTSLKDSIIYSTIQPCIICAKMIINAGIREVVIRGDYPDRMAKEFLEKAKVKVRTIN